MTDPTPNPTSQPPEEINVVLPEGYVIVKEDDLRALEAQLPPRQAAKLGKIGITKRDKKESKVRRQMAKRSRRINRGVK